MKIKIHSFILLMLLMTMYSEQGFAQDYEPKLDGLVTELSETTVGGTVLVAKDGKVVYRKAFGKADLELDVAMEPDCVHRIGSITKQFTAAAILKLQQAGQLSLQDDIRKYFKDYPVHGHTITVEHLLTHTSGIANYTSLPKFGEKIRRKDLTPPELIDFFKDEPMDFAPGESFKYNNSGYILLGHIIESVTGRTYAEFLRESFFEPLGMKDTRYDSSSEILKNRVPGYSWENGAYRNAPFLSMTLPYAGGSLISSVDDLFLWNTAIADYTVLNEESTAKAHSRFILKDGGPIDYGYGWRLGYVQGSPTIKHGGTVNGFSSYAIYLPEEKVYVAILTNCDCTWNIEAIASKMAAVAMGDAYDLKEVALPPGKLKAVQGVYRSTEGGKRTIRYEDGRLLFFEDGGEKSILVPIGQNRFRFGESLTVLEIKTDGKGFVMNGLDSPLEWQRTDARIIGFEPIVLPPNSMDRYLGAYLLPKDRIFKVVAENGKLFGQMGTNREEILPLDHKRFFAKGIDAQVIFDMSEEGIVTGLTIVQGGPKKGIKIK